MLSVRVGNRADELFSGGILIGLVGLKFLPQGLKLKQGCSSLRFLNLCLGSLKKRFLLSDLRNFVYCKRCVKKLIYSSSYLMWTVQTPSSGPSALNGFAAFMAASVSNIAKSKVARSNLVLKISFWFSGALSPTCGLSI